MVMARLVRSQPRRFIISNLLNELLNAKNCYYPTSTYSINHWKTTYYGLQWAIGQPPSWTTSGASQHGGKENDGRACLYAERQDVYGYRLRRADVPHWPWTAWNGSGKKGLPDDGLYQKAHERVCAHWWNRNENQGGFWALDQP